MTELLLLSSIHIIKNLPLTWILQLTVGQLVKMRLIMVIGQVKLNKHKMRVPPDCPESAIVLFGITNATLGAIIGLKCCSEGTIIWPL